MKLAIMQPYFLPYLGYFQLIAAVDKFVLLDDVTFIKRGWINRNRLLLNGKPHVFTLPLQGASQNKLICDTYLVQDDKWRRSFFKTLTQAYNTAPHFSAVSDLLTRIVCNDQNRLDVFLADSLIAVAEYIGIGTEIVRTSRTYGLVDITGQDRIIAICEAEGATRYINASGGAHLYERDVFRAANIELEFLHSQPLSYRQGKLGNQDFVADLSILDAMMFNEPEQLRSMLKAAEFA